MKTKRDGETAIHAFRRHMKNYTFELLPTYAWLNLMAEAIFELTSKIKKK